VHDPHPLMGGLYQEGTAVDVGGPDQQPALVVDPGGDWAIRRGPHPSGRTCLWLVAPELAGRTGAVADILGRLDHPGVARLVTEGHGRDVLVLEDPGGPSLASWRGARWSTSALLTLAEQVASALEALHGAGAVHGRLEMESFVLEAAAGAAVLVEVSSLARNASRAEPWVGRRAPEQADGPPDARSDLHALGAILYELCTGRPVFHASDPLEQRHLALASRPIPPDVLEPGVPAGLSDLLLRLLATDPADRHASATELRADLAAARRVFEAREDIPALRSSPARGGRPPGPATDLIGRDVERGLLHDALARVAAGACVQVEVVGPAGIGKTTLIETLRSATLARGGCFGLGRVDPLRAPRPLGALAGALDEIAAQLVSGDAARLEHVRRAVARAVGPNGPLIAALGHRLAWLVPDTDAPQWDEGVSAAAARLLDTVERFVVAVAAAAPPLVLALDDLHRADAETIRLFRTLTSAQDARYLLIVGGWRPDDDGAEPLVKDRASVPAPTEPSGGGALRVTLGGWEAATLVQAIRAAYGDLGAAEAPLSHLVQRRTQGNPLFVRAWLQRLHAAGAIVPDALGGHRVDLGLAATLDVGVGVAAMLVKQLQALPEDVRSLLAVGARIGGTFPSDLVARALDREDAEARLALAADAGILSRVDEGCWRFLHDRLQQAALELLDGAAAAPLHARLGALLCAALGPEPEAGPLLRAVHQRLLGVSALHEPSERVELVRSCLRAARVARTTGAFAAALGFVDGAVALLRDPALRLPAEAAALYLEGARAAVLAAPDRVDTLIDALLAETTDPEIVATALELRVDHEVSRGDTSAALVATRAALDRLGYHLPERVGKAHVVLSLLRAKFALRGRTPAMLLALPEVTDARAAAALRVLLRASTAAYLADPDLFAFLCGEMVRLGLRAGACPGTAWGVLVFAILQSTALRDPAGGYRLGEAACAMLERYAPHGLAAKAGSVWYATQHPTHHPLRDSLAPLRDLVQRGLAEGDALHAGICATFYVNHLVFSGEPLGRVVEEVNRVNERLQRHRQDIAVETSAPFVALARSLESGLPPADAPRDGTARPYQVFTVNFCGCVRAVLSGRDTDALAFAHLADPAREAVRGTVNEPLFHFYAAVAAGRQLAFGAVRDRATSRRLRVGLAEMRRCARTNPVDYTSRVALLEALDTCVRGKPASALAELDASVRSARSRGAPHEAALALETAALLHDHLGAEESCRLLRTAAAAAWTAWGSASLASAAGARVGLASRLPVVAAPGPDVEVVLRATEALASEVGRDALLASLVRLAAMQAGAERVVLVGVEGEELRVRAVYEQGAVVLLSGQPLAGFDRACAAAVRLAARTGELVSEPDANRPEAFGHDPWVRASGVRSVLALPVFLRGALESVLLLEHTHRSAAFVSTAGTSLRVLASVATALLENAGLLATLETRAAELRDANATLQAHSLLLEGAVHARTAELDALTRLQASVLDALSEGVCGIGADGRVTFANPAAASLLGFPIAALVGAPFHDTFHLPEGGDQGACALCASASPLQDVPARLRRSDGEDRWVECAVQPTGEGERVLSFRDVGRRRELETQVRQSQKMDAIGLFVGGVAHEFNNLLTPILGRVDLVRVSLGQDHPLQESLASLEQAGERAADLVRQLRALGRQTQLERRPIDLAAAMHEALELVRPTLDRRVTLTSSAGDSTWALADPGQVRQILVNLCHNARDAVLGDPLGDRPTMIDVGVRRIVVTADDASRDPSASPGAWVVLDVADTGAGMSPEVLARIFEPFFTTRRVGKGTGLGLAVLHGIVQQHGGWVSVRSVVGEGTRFRCAFPPTPPPAHVAAPEAHPPAPQPGGRHRILVVDDEALVRNVTRSALEHYGYVVEESVSGDRALERLGDAPGLDLVLLDRMMPGLDGWDTLAAIRERWPTLPVILMSGFDTTSGDTRASPPDAHVNKPFHVRELITAVRRVIGERPAS
jgi:signal transduction histidine kinase/predicted ATPase